MITTVDRKITGRTRPFMVVCLLAACSVWVSCNSHSVEPFAQNIVAEQGDTVEAAGTSKVDILWIVDNSGSMCEEQASLRENFDSFVDGLILAKTDFQLAVITTDMENPAESGRFQNIPDDTPGSQCNIPVDISQCPTKLGEEAPPLVIRSDDPRYLGADGEPDKDKIKRDFGCNATTGITGNGFEMGLESARTALSPALTQGYNAGFLRDDAFLAIIFLTDENDCSDGGALNLTNGNICEWERDSLIPVQEYIDFFSSLKKDLNGDPNLERVIMAGILAPNNNIQYEYGQEVDPSCVVQDDEGNVTGRGYAGYRYSSVLEAFPNTYEDNICNPPFDQALKAISLLIVEANNDGCLSAPPLTCKTDGDCASGSCQTPEGSNNSFCESFRIQVELERPVGDGVPSGFEMVESERDITFGQPQCAMLSGSREDVLRCVFVEGTHYTVNYNEPTCTVSKGLAINFTAEQGARDTLTYRYPKAIVVPDATAGETAETGETGDGAAAGE